MPVDRAAPSDARADVRPSEVGGGANQVGELLMSALRSLEVDQSDQSGRIAVLDCGGGSGRLAVPLAVAGATVTVVDISVDALATLRRRAIEAGVADRIVPVQGDVESLADAVPAGAFDLVLAHGILEVVDPITVTFAAIAGALRPGGLLSVLVGNPVAVVLARALAGDLVGAERELAAADRTNASGGSASGVSASGVSAPDGATTPERPSPQLVQHLCAEHGLRIEHRHGIGVFRDLVPGTALDLPGARDAVARLDAACAQRSPFAEIAGHVHLLARRDGEPAVSGLGGR